MKLQAALDYFTLADALCLMQKISDYVDIAEIGSPLMYADGFRAVSMMKKLYPHIEVLADMKIVDGGYDISSAAFDAGADIVTSIALTNDATLKGLVRAAHERGKKAMADTIGVCDLAKRVRELDDMGFDYILGHTAHDLLDSASASVDGLSIIKDSARNAKAGISGGITPEQMPAICRADPDWVVVGSGLTTAEDPREIARKLKTFMAGNKNYTAN